MWRVLTVVVLAVLLVVRGCAGPATPTPPLDYAAAGERLKELLATPTRPPLKLPPGLSSLPTVTVIARPTPSAATPVVVASEIVELLGTALALYEEELALARTIAVESLNQQASFVAEGTINTLEFRKRDFQIHLIWAHTIENIDSKPDYAILHPFLWSERDGQPPSLAFCIPELAPDREKAEVVCSEYFRSRVLYHDVVVGQFAEWLREYEDEGP